MKICLKYKALFVTIPLLMILVPAVAQTDRKAAEMKNLEAAVANSRVRVAMNEKRVTDADSIINAGKRMLDESKAEMKAVDSGSRKLEKEYAAKRRPVTKLADSKDKTEANRARTDLRAIDAQYKTDNRALETRLREALRKQTAGITNIQKGKTARKNAMEALKVSNNALKAAQAKYNAAAGSVNP
jgi:chromosome segregation ATPase